MMTECADTSNPAAIYSKHDDASTDHGIKWENGTVVMRIITMKIISK